MLFRSEMRTRGDSPGQGEETLALSLQGQTSKRRYRDFLRRFSAYKEEVHLDPDSFDPGFYAYGLSLYGNLPLIEPQETREAKNGVIFKKALLSAASQHHVVYARFRFLPCCPCHPAPSLRW